MSPDPTIGASSPGDPQDGDAAGVQPPLPELEALARLLSDSRQAQGLSVVELAQRLHMGVQQLKALECGDQQQLPEPVFVIAQARRVADALGVEISAHIEALRSSERFMHGGTSYWPGLKADVFQAARARQRPGEGPQSPAKAKHEPKAQSTGQPETKPESKVNSPVQLQPASNPALSQSQQARAQPSRALAWLLLLAGVVAAGAWGLQRGSSWVEASRRALSPPPQAKPQAPPAAAIQPTELLITASQPSWLEVRPAAGGEPLFRGTFIGERRFDLAAGLSLRAGRPDLVLVSDGSAPPKPLGTISEIRWVSFKPLPQPQQSPPQS